MNTGLCVVVLHIRTQFLNPLTNFRFFGATLRGGFGQALKKVCVQLTSLSPIDDVQDIYSLAFETPIRKDTQMMRKYPFAPHPFVFSLHNPNTYHRSNGRIITLILIGTVIKYTPYFIEALQELGKTGLGKYHIPFDIENVTDSDDTVIYKDGQWYESDYATIDDTTIIQRNTLDCSGQVSIQFLSPCRIKYEGRFTDQIEFHVLIRTLLRRISSLTYFHCCNQLDWDFKSIINEASGIKIRDQKIQWVDQSRYSTRQKRRMTLGGVVGVITYEGNIKPFIRLLLWGELLHAGKGTSFGLGQYTFYMK